MLALYGASLVRVVHAGDFRYGDNWRENIEKELSDADWLLYLFTDQDEDWGFCLFECGFVRSTMMSNPNKKLITLAREPHQINDALTEFNAVPMTDEAVFDLLKQIYREEPWRINPGLPDEVLRTTAHKIFMIFGGIHTFTEQRDVIPSITIEFDEAERASLESESLCA